MGPAGVPGWLAALSDSVADAARAFAAGVHVLSALAAQVPRCAHDESGATPWTSPRQELAVARQVCGQAAAAELRIAVRLTSVPPHTPHLLGTGRITVPRGRVFGTEPEVLDDELAAQLDGDLADRIATLATQPRSRATTCDLDHDPPPDPDALADLDTHRLTPPDGHPPLITPRAAT